MSGLMLKRDRYEEVCCTSMTWITRIQPDTHTHTHTCCNDRVTWAVDQCERVWKCGVWACERLTLHLHSYRPQRPPNTHTHTLTHSHLSISHRYTATFRPHCCEKSGIRFDLWHLSLCALLELIHANGALTAIRKYTYDSYALLITSLKMIPPSDCICFSIESHLFCFWKACLSFLIMYEDHLDR